LGFYKHTATVVDVNLRVVVLVELVIRGPKPNVLEVTVGVLGDVELHKGANALWVGLVGGIGVLLAVGGLELGSGVTANTEVDVPKTGCTALCVDVPFHQDTTGSRTLSTDDEVGGFKGTLVTALSTNLESRLGVVHVGEELACDEESAVDFTNHLDVFLSGDNNSLSDKVGTVVDVENLTLLKTIDSSLDSSRVIGLTVTHCALGLQADKLGDIDILVLGLAALEPTIVALEALGLRGCTVDVTLNTT
jgi:hypothetical protein